MHDFNGKAAFVTGGASGIGLGLARAFLEAGMRVMLADIEKVALDRALAELKTHDNRVRGVLCDVSDRSSLHRAVSDAISAFGNVHVVCNNAGVGGGGPMDEIAPRDWDWVLDVNLKGVIYGITEFLPHIKAHGEGGHFVNTASMAGMMGIGAMGPYCASKFAVVSLSESLAGELEAGGFTNIGVSVLCPGWVKTSILESRRNRQDRFGGQSTEGFARPNTPIAVTAAESIAAGMDPKDVAARVLAAMRDDDLYIFTHPQMRDRVEQRFQRIRAAFDKAEQLQAAQLKETLS